MVQSREGGRIRLAQDRPGLYLPQSAAICFLLVLGAFMATGCSAPTTSNAPGPTRRLPVQLSFMKVVTWSPAGDQIAVGGTIPPAKIVDANSGELVTAFRGVSTRHLEWSPDGVRLAVVVSSPASVPTDSLRIWDTRHERWEFSGGPPGEAGSIAWSHDGKRLAVATGIVQADGTISDSTVSLYSTTNWEVTAAFPYTEGVSSVTWSPDDKQVAFVGGFYVTGQYSLVIMDAGKTGQAEAGSNVVRVLPTGADEPSDLEWSPTGPQTLAAGFRDGTVRLFDTGTGQTTVTLQHGNNGVSSIAWSPDGKRLASGGPDDTVKLWDATSGREVKAFKHEQVVDSVSWSPDGAQLAVACETNEVWVWDTR